MTEAESNWTARVKLAVEEDSMAEDDEHQIPTNSNDEVGVEERTILSPIIEEDSKEMSVEEKSSSESESDSEDEGAQDAHVLSLEAAVAENPLSYDTHMEYIKALRKYGHVEKLRNAREAMSALFPLNPMMWQEWTKDEACLITSSEAVSSIEPLYERAVHEYLSVPLWSEYLNFIQERDESVSQCTPEGVEKIRTLFERALTAAGLHVVDGGKLWAAYREFEQALLIAMEENSKEVKDKQVDRIRNLFRRQLSVPLSDIDSTLQDYKFWEEQKGTVIGNDTDQLTGLPSNVISGYKRALQMYNARAGYEEKVAGGKHADAELFQNYLSYINFEESSGDPARVQVLYERAITEFPVANDLWLSYTQYLDSNLKVPSIIKSVYSRAVRNCPWVEALWAKYMLALERFDASEEELSAVFEQSLQCGFSNPNEYLDLFLVRADALRRRIMKMDEISKSSYLDLLRETFQRAAEYLSSHLNYTDQFLHLHAYWAQLEYHLGQDLAAARRVWESLIKTSGGMLEVWQGYINMEVSAGNINEARALYKKCYSRRFKDSGSEEICESWLRFEREHGSLDDLDWAVMKVTPRLKELRLFQQQEETKSQEIVEPSSIGQKDVITKSHTKEKDTQPASNKRSNSLQASRKRKTGVGYNDGKDQFKRQKGAQGKGLSYVAPDKEGELGLSNRDDKERDTVSRELVDREANQQTEVANLDSSAKPVYTDQCTVFLSNLSLEVTEEQLRRFFSDTGGVVAIRLLRDRFSGKPRGLAYIDFENEEKLSSAVEKNRQKLLGKRISIARSNPKQSQRERSGRGHITGGRGGRALSGRGSGTRTDERHGSSAQSASPAVSNRQGGHVKLTGSNTFALPRNVARAARPLGWGVKDNRSIEAEETPKSNEEFRKFLLKS